MTASFPILQLRTDSPETVEQLGSKPKFWFRIEDDPQPWLFKFTREGTGEAWSEKIASEIAQLLGVSHARVELADFMGRRGCASRSFVLRDKGWSLIHGSEILAGRVFGYDRTKQRHQCDHTIANIFAAVEAVFSADDRPCQLATLAGYLVLDAVICNTDRHHDNWGVLHRTSEEEHVEHAMAPSFDHASSLGRELLDEKRERLMREDTTSRYVEGGRGGIYWESTDSKGSNPLALVQSAATRYPEYFRPWIERVRSLDIKAVEVVVSSVPEEWMSETARQFCVAMIEKTTQTLRSIQQ